MKVTIGLFFGGRSTEHEVSVITGLQAYAAIDKEKYNVIPVYITKENDFYTGEKIGLIEEYSDIPNLLKNSVRAAIFNNTGRVGLYPVKKGKIDIKKPIALLDAALPAVHGTNVEDGALQGFFETLRLPYAGCDVLSSATGMDKEVMKAVLKQADIPVLDCITFTSKGFADDAEKVIAEIGEKIGYPCIVKPINLGSSIGIKLAKDKESLEEAISHALLFTDRVLAEKAITKLKEVNCAVLGDRDSAEAGECEEPVSEGELLDFNDKYVNQAKSGDGGSGSKGMASLKRKIPADISGSQREEIRDMAVKAFQALGCEGVARIDFLIDTSQTPQCVYFNEINTIPGSFAFYLWEPTGLKYPELLDRLITLALKREREKSNLNYTFESNILAGFKDGGVKGGKL